jgi:hypothetical protein
VRFSERKGIKKVSEIIQIEGMNPELRSSLWNVLDLLVWRSKDFMHSRYEESGIDEYSKVLWFGYFKKPIDSRPEHANDILGEIRDYFFKCQWYEVYDFLEFTLESFRDASLNKQINSVLERELSGYRYISGVITDVTSEQEVQMLDAALSKNDYPPARLHLQRALELLSNREKPDYRNSIKESISAVESMARIITNDDKATLGEALKALGRSVQVHSALKEGFLKLYGYTSDAQGIRHAMMEEPDLTSADAKFFLLSCTSFINYLKAKCK